MAGPNSLETVESPAVAAARRRARDILLAPPRLLSIAFGTWFWWEALVPSLLPRSGLLQGVIGGVSFAVGWLVGSMVGQLWDRSWRRFGRRDPLGAARPWLLVGVAVLAVVGAVVGTVLWLRWQNQQRSVVGPDEVLGLTDAVRCWLATLVIAAIAVGAGRLAWFLVVRITDQLPQRWSSPVRYLVAGAGFGVLTVGVGAAILSFVVVPVLDATYSEADAAPVPGVLAPQTATVSGGPGSLVQWSSLGTEGRTFTATASSTDALRTFRPDSAPTQPVRVYVGLRSAPDAAARADLAVRELERAGGFQRRYLVVWTVTGTGWVDPVAAAALEFVAGGDTAIVAQQYSYLPSWISFLVDKDTSAQAGASLYNAVHARWSQLPAATRPRLVVFGESLGSFGSEAAFARATDAQTLDAASGGADSALWVGPTHDNAVWTALEDSRAPGSPVWAPAQADGSLRLADHGEQLGAPPPRVLWVQHPSDPVGWWSWSTFWASPDWMHQPTGDDVPKDPSWFPVVTMLQATSDLMNGFSASPGHGHNYNPDFDRAWAALLAPSSWTTGETDRLAQVLAHVSE